MPRTHRLYNSFYLIVHYFFSCFKQLYKNWHTNPNMTCLPLQMKSSISSKDIPVFHHYFTSNSITKNVSKHSLIEIKTSIGPFNPILTHISETKKTKDIQLNPKNKITLPFFRHPSKSLYTFITTQMRIYRVNRHKNKKPKKRIPAMTKLKK